MSKFAYASPSPTSSTPRPRSPSLTSLSDNNDDDDDFSSLPFPAPLSRDAFTAPGPFDPHAFLRTLHNRHQTLEDLRAELRQRSRAIEEELVELVNRDYGDFIGLGMALEGGEGRVEDLRVGVLGFRRKVEGLRGELVAGVGEVEAGIREAEGVGREKETVARLIAVGKKIDELEGVLGIGGEEKKNWYGEGFEGSERERLRELAGGWAFLKHLEEGVKEHPFIAAQKGRMENVREKILQELTAELKKTKAAEKRDGEWILGLLSLFEKMGERSRALKVVKQTRS